MEHKIGEVFEYDSEKGKVLLKVKKDNSNDCRGCFFFFYQGSICNKFKCSPDQREDKNNVKFIQILQSFKPFDVVIYKPTGERGLVKSCNGDNTFVLFRIQSTAHCCKTSDLELE